MANKDNHYFSNILTFVYAGERDSSILTSNENAIDQRMRSHIRDFSNTLHYTPALKNGDVISLHWYINHYNQPQALSLSPGIHAEVLHGGEPFASIRQFAETPTWFSRFSADYRITQGHIKPRSDALRIGTKSIGT